MAPTLLSIYLFIYFYSSFLLSESERTFSLNQTFFFSKLIILQTNFSQSVFLDLFYVRTFYSEFTLLNNLKREIIFLQTYAEIGPPSNTPWRHCLEKTWHSWHFSIFFENQRSKNIILSIYRRAKHYFFVFPFPVFGKFEEEEKMSKVSANN